MAVRALSATRLPIGSRMNPGSVPQWTAEAPERIAVASMARQRRLTQRALGWTPLARAAPKLTQRWVASRAMLAWVTVALRAGSATTRGRPVAAPQGRETVEPHAKRTRATRALVPLVSPATAWLRRRKGARRAAPAAALAVS